LRPSFIFFLYRAALAIASPFILLYLLWRVLLDRRYLAGLGQRFGLIPHALHQTAPGAIWLHAVSVGEVQAASRLLEKLRREIPGTRLFVSVGTVAGRQLADQKLKEVTDGIFYAPLDFVFAVREVLRRLRPALVIVLETEIWPNLWRESKRSGASLMVVNGRISDKAMPAYRRFRWFFPAVLRQPDIIHAQSRLSHERYLELGADPARLLAAGNLKYDLQPGEAPQAVISLLARIQPSHVWIAASTMAPAFSGDHDEDEVALDAFERLATHYPRLLMILAPRRPERFDFVAARLQARNLSFLRRSALMEDAELRLPGVLLLDTIGELAGSFSLADVVFMGGTLAARGGHNLLEPAFFGVAVISGPNLQNFPEIAGDFRAKEALYEIQEPGQLSGAVRNLLEDAPLRKNLGERARRLSRARSGATQTGFDTARKLIDHAVPQPLPTPLSRILLIPLSWLWRAGAAWKRRRQLYQPFQLPVPVISVGGISMGGAGKTPLALFLGRHLDAAGYRPGFLTRGYRRRTPTPFTLVPRGGKVATEISGDEAQIIVRSQLGPVGIGADRYLTGQKLIEQFHNDVVILDDGFQHWRLARDIDLVLIDALRPFGEVFPAGMLREPLSALARASAFLITRAEPGRAYGGIVARLRRHNPQAPVFYSRLVPRGWVDCCSGQEFPVESMLARPSAAFCGLGNPASFWSSLQAMGCKPALRVRFSDHHRYRPREIRRLAAQAKSANLEVVLTTEKDLINLPASTPSLLEPLRLYWLRIGVEIDNQDEFLRWLLRRLPPPSKRSG
jgi:3-deoxy-D-manno-octulosonic-acid transferase